MAKILTDYRSQRSKAALPGQLRVLLYPAAFAALGEGPGSPEFVSLLERQARTILADY